MSDRTEARPPLPPPRFSLRTLLLVITLCGIFFGSFWWFSPPIVIAGSVAAIMVAAHVLGNSLGTQLRDRAAARPRVLDTKLQAAEIAENHAPTTHLGQSSSLGWSMLWPTLGGAALGMIGGCWWIESAYHIGFDLSGLAMAATAFGVLGGCASFAIATFTQVLIVALWQALRHK